MNNFVRIYKSVLMCSSSGMASPKPDVQRLILGDSMIEGISDQVLLAIVLSITFLAALAYMLLR